MAMAKIKIDADDDIDIHENSLDNSADSEYLRMVDEGSFGEHPVVHNNNSEIVTRGNGICLVNTSAEERSQLVTQQYLDTNENSSSYHFRDISSSVTYKLIPMAGEESTNNMASSSPPHEYYVISNPVEVFGTTASPKKASSRREPLQAKAFTAKKRDDKRRATHNEVERRRRDKINSWISKLAALVPAAGRPDASSKGGILAKACDHITDLTHKQKKLEKLEVENQKLVLEVLRLTRELTDVRRENSNMRDQLADNCIVSHRPKGQKS